MDNDIQYFKAVIDTAQLISIWLKNNNQDIKKILSNLEITLEEKYGPFTSKLSNQIGVNDTLGLKTPDSYWKGVQDTLALIRNFYNFKIMSNSPRSIENFLLEIVNKSNVRLEPDESPLISALGISFDQEFSDSIPSVAQETHKVLPQSEIPYEKQQINEPEISLPSEPSSVATFVQESIDEVPVEASSSQDEFNPEEFIDDEKFLEQFIADSTNPKESNISSEEITDLGRDYLRSALEELTSSDSEENNEQNVDIQFAQVQPDKGSSENVVLESDDIIDDALNEKQSSRLLSSSLRDALRMLREED